MNPLDISPISEDIATWVNSLVIQSQAHDGERYKVTRSGPREPIPYWVRRLIVARDGRRCQLCGDRLTRYELDHVIPWSAGGSDHSSNLRATCVRCNQARSNFKVADDRTYLPVMQDCLRCQGERYKRNVQIVPCFCGNHGGTGYAYADETRW